MIKGHNPKQILITKLLKWYENGMQTKTSFKWTKNQLVDQKVNNEPKVNLGINDVIQNIILMMILEMQCNGWLDQDDK